jgi:hypothetical protein
VLLNRLRPYYAAMLAVVFLSACWEPNEVVVQRVVPGVVALPGAQYVAVGEITGPGGEKVGHLLASRLMELGQFAVLDWSSAYATGIAREGWAERQGGWRTADATVLGSIEPADIVPMYEVRSARAADGREITTYSRSLQLTLTGYFRVIDPQNGMIITTTRASGYSTSPIEQVTVSGAPSQDEAYVDSLFGPGPVAALQQIAVEELVSEMQSLMACDYVETQVVLWHDGRNADLQRAIDAAKQGDWHDAREVYQASVFEMEQHAPSEAYVAHYNYGVALALSGELARGIAEVETALDLKANAKMRKTLQQLRGYQAESLARQGQAQVKR